MRAACYEANRAAREALRVGSVATPLPGPGEIHVRGAASGNRFAPGIALTLSLDEIAAAHEAVEAGISSKAAIAPP